MSIRKTYTLLNLDISMARGKPCKEQIDLSMPMLDIFNSGSNLIINNTDYRNYGILDGIPECKRMFSDITGLKEENIIVYGNASLYIMASLVEKAMLHGVNGGIPFSKQSHPVSGNMFVIKTPIRELLISELMHQSRH